MEHEKILGVEGGGTKTAWVLTEHDGGEFRILDQGKLPKGKVMLRVCAVNVWGEKGSSDAFEIVVSPILEKK